MKRAWLEAVIDATVSGAVVRATVITDRGAYRPDETLHVMAIVRRVEGATMTVPPRRAVTLRLMSPTSTVPIGTQPVPLSEAGVVSATFALKTQKKRVHHAPHKRFVGHRIIAFARALSVTLKKRFNIERLS